MRRAALLGLCMVVLHHAKGQKACRFQSVKIVEKLNVCLPGTELGPVISPDGRKVAFEYFHPEKPNTPQIWVTDRDQNCQSRALVDNENYNSWPSWSPDGQWISFVSAQQTTAGTGLTSQIYKVRVADGLIVQLTHFPLGTSLGDSTSWSRDGRIAFEYRNDIYVVAESEGTPQKLVDLKPFIAPDSLWGIQWCPDGSRLTLRAASLSSPRQKRIWIADLKGLRVRPITTGPKDENPSWLDSQHIVYEHWNPGGEVRACAVCLHALKVRCLTKGHIDLSPTVGSLPGRSILFARGDILREDTNAWKPTTHIYMLNLSEDGQTD